MTKALTIRYTVQSGSLPNGIKLDPDTGVLSGSAGFDSLNTGPTWSSPDAGSLGTFNVGDTFPTVSFSASSSKTPVRFSLASSQDHLPWGLRLNPQDGTITGSIAPLKQRVNERKSFRDGPAWTTTFGRLVSLTEGMSANITLSATPISSRTIKNFQVVDGYLPFGLKLNATTGTISGTAANLFTRDPFVDVPNLPIPAWQTVADLGTYNEYSGVNLSLAATPASGRSMVKYVLRSGYLPFGLKLNQAAGTITGTIANLHFRNEPVYYDSTKNPTFSATVENYRSSTTLNLPNGGSVGTFSRGALVGLRFSVAAGPGKQLKNCYISSGYLPFGLKAYINPSGNRSLIDIDGTILNDANRYKAGLGTYTFTIAVVDQADGNFLVNTSYRTYTITVN